MNIGVVGYKGFIGNNLLKCAHKDWKFIPLDIPPHWNAFTDYLDLKQFDILINAAGSANVIGSFNDPVIDFNNNVDLPLYLLETIRKSNKTVTFINFSSAAVYGKSEILPIQIDFALQPMSPYGSNKLISENVLQSYQTNFGIQALSLRIFSAYGIPNKKQVFWDLCTSASSSANGSLVIQGNADDTRDFINIKDLLSQVILILSNRHKLTQSYFNIANGQQVEIGYVAELIANQFNINETIFNEKQMKGYPSKWQAHIADLNELGYVQEVSIEDGVIQYCNWFKEITLRT